MRRMATLPAIALLIAVGSGMGYTQEAIAEVVATTTPQIVDRCPMFRQAGNRQLREPSCFTPSELRDSQRSLTVIGQGQVTAPADTVILEFRLATRDLPGGASPLSAQEVRQLTEAALKPTLQALTEAGVPAKNIAVQASSLQNQKLFVTLNRRPTQERVQQVAAVVEKSLAANPQLFVQNIGAAYSVNNCQPLERSARRIALRDAQTQVTTLASDINAQLGPLFSVTVLPLTGSPTTSGCGSKVGVSVSALGVSLDESTPPYDPTDKPEVTVRSQVSVTYDIEVRRDPAGNSRRDN